MKAKDQETIDLVILLRAFGFTHREVAEELNARGILTQANTHWHKRNIRKIHKTKRPAATDRLGSYSKVEFGWTSDGTRLIPCEEERTILDTTYEMRVKEKMCYREIAHSLNATGYRTRGAKLWSASSLAKLMSSRIDKNLEASIEAELSTRPAR